MKLGIVTMATVVLLGSVTAARATPITFTEQFTASGSLGGSAFNNVLVTINLLGDTSTVIGSAGHFNSDFGTATVIVSGLGAATFTDPQWWALDNPQGGTGSSPVAGIADVTLSRSIALTIDPTFATYDLRSSIGPVTGQGLFSFNFSAPTTSGNLVLTSVAGNTSTFSATTAVPEPATLTLTILGLAGVVGRHRRRQARRTSS